MLKAYWVRAKDGEHQEVLFAESSSKAKSQSEAACWVDWIDIRVTRTPEFDKYVDQGKVPIQALLEADWWFECRGCLIKVTLEDAIVVNDKPYCTDCRDKLESHPSN